MLMNKKIVVASFLPHPTIMHKMGLSLESGRGNDRAVTTYLHTTYGTYLCHFPQRKNERVPAILPVAVIISTLPAAL